MPNSVGRVNSSLTVKALRCLIIPSLVYLHFTSTFSFSFFNKPFPLNTCPLQFFCRCHCLDQTSLCFNLYNHLISKISCILSLQLIFSSPLHNHASNAFNLLISSCSNAI